MKPITELFNVPEVLSPRLAWLKRHDVKTDKSSLPAGEEPWSAWVGNMQEAWDTDAFQTGETEDEALTRLAKGLKIPLWNEEGYKK